MGARWQALGIVAGALALPGLLALLASGSCSLADLYDGAGGQGGSSGGSGGGGDGGPDADAGPSPCPADMVAITVSADGGYCIDRTEVTNLAYAKFESEADAAGPQAPQGRCDWNDSYAPAVPTSGGDTLPVLGVDWCDAFAYCRWAGKRLCGDLAGGPIAVSKRDLGGSQWFRACSRNDARNYPYGDTFDPAACVDCTADAGCAADAGAPAAQPAAVGSRKGCTGGYTGIDDMSGNAAEWEDGCDDAGVRPDASDDAGKPIPDPRYDVCYHRGGSFADTGSPLGQACLACSTAGCAPSAEVRSRHPHNVGLRCCLDY